MNYIRQHILFRYFWLLMAAHIFNCVVDAPDPAPQSMPEDLSYNDMESIVEVITEQVLGWDNFFPEYDDHDSEDSELNKSKKSLDIFETPSKFIFPKKHLSFAWDTSLASFADDRCLNQYLGRPTAPPPWQV